MPKTITVCERGECGGECLRCTYRRLSRQYAALEAKHNELRGAVAEMRRLQREYFKHRDRATLARSRRFEQKVDRLIEEADAQAVFF